MRAHGWSMAIGLALAGWTGAARADLNLPDPDVTPPTVAIVTPTAGQVFPAATPVAVEVQAEDPPPESSGVAEVWLEVDGEPRLDMLDDEAPYGFSLLMLAPGSHSVRALARDWEGNEAASEAVTFSIDAPAGQDESGGGGTSGAGAGGSSSGDAASSGGTQAEGEALDRGCACRSGGERHGALGSALLVLVLAGLRRSARPRARDA